MLFPALVYVLDSYDLATIAALRYAKSLRPAALRAVHLSIDNAHADKLAQRWLSAGVGIPWIWWTARTAGSPMRPPIWSLARP